jgi:hypothetical protein
MRVEAWRHQGLQQISLACCPGKKPNGAHPRMSTASMQCQAMLTLSHAHTHTHTRTHAHTHSLSLSRTTSHIHTLMQETGVVLHELDKIGVGTAYGKVATIPASLVKPLSKMDDRWVSLAFESM